MSEALKYTIMLSFTGACVGRRQHQQQQQQQSNNEFNLDAYATGTIRLSYDAA